MAAEQELQELDEIRRELRTARRQRALLAADCARLRAEQQANTVAPVSSPPSTPSTPVQPAATAPSKEGDVRCEGYMFKLGAGALSSWSWARRYFVLCGGRLVYYEMAADVRAGRPAKGVINMSNYEVVMQEETNAAYRLVANGRCRDRPLN
eukprot:SAG31_NODE_5669_length_2393_cov_1.883173_2_plen_152_part_00